MIQQNQKKYRPNYTLFLQKRLRTAVTYTLHESQAFSVEALNFETVHSRSPGKEVTLKSNLRLW